ncbi:MAG: twin-arginine translocation signal domain-containing protein [Culturomica sp.]|jgi:hypothetical protein|nr:twin-arginine translocation signal domain-containing protein [Culturomica sp.]
MEQKADKEQNISRRKFLQLCGTAVAGVGIAGVAGVFLHRKLTAPLPYASVRPEGANSGQPGFASPYRLESSFQAPGAIEAFELAGDRLIVAASNQIYMYDTTGALAHSFAVGSDLRDIAADERHIYLLFPARIEVYSPAGEWLRDWEACDDTADYCSMALTPSALFVTDAANKNICQYTAEGQFVRFIQSPDGFIVPSYSFGITYADGVIYCSNPGRHRVEKYTPDGAYTGFFGEAGETAGRFGGCCNPVHLTHTAAGEIITSEKGKPRISCYGTDGTFRSLLLDSPTLGGGHTAYDVKILKGRLFVAGNSRISVYRYDSTQAAATACSTCKADCPLRKGVTI